MLGLQRKRTGLCPEGAGHLVTCAGRNWETVMGLDPGGSPLRRTDYNVRQRQEDRFGSTLPRPGLIPREGPWKMVPDPGGIRAKQMLQDQNSSAQDGRHEGKQWLTRLRSRSGSGRALNTHVGVQGPSQPRAFPGVVVPGPGTSRRHTGDSPQRRVSSKLRKMRPRLAQVVHFSGPDVL